MEKVIPEPAKKRYMVGARVVYVSYRTVLADSPEEAIELAKNKGEMYLEYSHEMNTNTWTAEQTGV